VNSTPPFTVRTILLVVWLTGFWLPSYSSEVANSCGAEVPRLEWIKAELQRILSNPASAALEVSPDMANLTQNQVTSVAGHFTSKEKIQQILCIPAKSTSGKNLGWETNLWLLIECDSSSGYKTIATSRGDVVYGSSLVDVDNDGLMEVPMVNEYTEACGTKNITYKLFSFKTMGFLYESTSKDLRKTLIGDKKCKKINKGTLLYNILQVEYKDVDHDGDLEIIENWVNFNYNGGKSMRQVELNKTMSSNAKVLYLNQGAFKP
jgi:hypothetical protein